VNVSRVLLSRMRLARHALLSKGRGRTRAKSPLVVVALLLAMTAIAISGFLALFRALIGAGAPPSELTAALGLVLDAAAMSLIVLGLDATVATLLLDPDLELLRRAPVRPTSLLALKLLDALPRTGTPLLVLAMPAIVAFGVVGDGGVGMVPVLVLALAALWLASIGFGVALALPLLRVVPARAAREALGLVATLVLTAVWLANALWLPRLADEGGAPLEGIRGALRIASRYPALTPGRAAAAAVHAWESGNAARAWTDLGALAVGATFLAALAGARFLPTVLETMATPAPRAEVPRPRLPRRPDAPRGWLGAVLARDARLFFRDWTVLADIVMAAVLWALLPFLSRAVFATGGAALVTTMLASLAIGLGYEVAARSVPFERRAATWMQLSPVPPGRWVLAKLAGSVTVAGPIFLVGWLVLSLSLRLAPSVASESLAVGLGALILSLGLGLWAGTRFGDPRWINPRAMLTLGGRLAAAGLMILQISFWIAVVKLMELKLPAMPDPLLVALVVPVAILLAAVPIRSAQSRLTRLGWYS
jgi:hypothetical protein